MMKPKTRLTEEIKYITLYKTSQICMGDDIVGGVILIIQRSLEEELGKEC